ncbi:hypothetical protein I552_1825 [Mycobacterium xenopi 3993]|nr:hypothetical protein I552_1825 [Mycobacterium xenopi 3993]
MFFRDARVLSRWELRLHGQTAEPLAVHTPEAFAAQFLLRRAPRAGRTDSTLLIVRERLIADGMRETISLHNLDSETTVVSLQLVVDADFADLFAVKEGRSSIGSADMTVTDNELVLSDRADPVRGLTVTATGDPIVLPGSLAWRIVVPSGEQRQIELIAEPTEADRKLSPGCAAARIWRPAHPRASWRPGVTLRRRSKPTIRCSHKCCGAPKVTSVRC